MRKTLFDARVDFDYSAAAAAGVTGKRPPTEQDEELSRRRKTKRRINDSRRKCIEHNETILKLLKHVQNEEVMKHVEATLKTLKNDIEAHVPLETELELAINTIQNKKIEKESVDSLQQKELMEAIKSNIRTVIPLRPSD